MLRKLLTIVAVLVLLTFLLAPMVLAQQDEEVASGVFDKGDQDATGTTGIVTAAPPATPDTPRFADGTAPPTDGEFSCLVWSETIASCPPQYRSYYGPSSNTGASFLQYSATPSQ